DLAAREPRVALRATYYKAPRRVDVDVGVGDREARFREHRSHHQRDHARPDFLIVDLVRVLGGDHELADAHRPAVLVHDADLSLTVGPEPREVAALADDREPLGEAMGE